MDKWFHSNTSYGSSHIQRLMDQLQHRFGDKTVHVSVSPSGRFDGPEAGSLWGLGEAADVLVRPPSTYMKIIDFLALSRDERVKETLYLEYLALHQYLGEDFSALLPLPFPLESSSSLQPSETKLKHLVTNLWIGGRPTTSPLHYDDYENLLCQIAGQKELILYPPHDLSKLYYRGRHKGKLQYRYPNEFTRDPSQLSHQPVIFGSSIIVDQLDLLTYPLYKDAKPVRVLLQPGDVLYIPAYWHHEVQSLPDEQVGLHIAVNFWFQNLTYPVDEATLLGRKP
jgi:jumonji domain-containing protein 7